jgi:thiol-disulfide isomerase/thioredoxin
MKSQAFSFSTFVFLTCAVISYGAMMGCRSSKKTTSTRPPKTSTRPRPNPQSDTDVAQPTSPAKPSPTNPAPIETIAGSKIAFIKSNRLMPVLEEANKQNKPVFVEFYASWCGPCKTLEKEVFNTIEVSSFVNEHFVSVKISLDTEDGKAVAQLYAVEKLPSMLFLDKKGNEVNRIVGTTTPGRFIRAGADALEKI